MDELSAEEWELLALFEKEPERQGFDDIWMFDYSVYKAKDGSLLLTCSINPYHKDINLILWKSGKKIYEYSALEVKDISVSVDTLNLIISESEVIFVKIRPKITIKHERKSET